MPFPIAKLAYGLRRRLHDLATPRERYQLQTAAANFSICPPIQTVQMIDDTITFVRRNGVTELAGRYPTDSPNPLNDNSLLSGRELVFSNVSSEDLTSPILNQLFIGAEHRLVFVFCNLSNDFLKTFKQLCPFSTRILISDSSLFTFNELLTTFPKLKKLHIMQENIPKTWATDLLPFSGQLSFLEFDCYDDVLMDTTCDQLVMFLKAQKRGFRLQVEHIDASKEYFTTLLRKLKARLPRWNKSKPQDVTRVILNYYNGHKKNQYVTNNFLPYCYTQNVTFYAP